MQSHQLGLKHCLLKKIDFLKNSRLNSHKSAFKQRNVQNCNETNKFNNELLLVFQKKHVNCK